MEVGWMNAVVYQLIATAAAVLASWLLQTHTAYPITNTYQPVVLPGCLMRKYSFGQETLLIIQTMLKVLSLACAVVAVSAKSVKTTTAKVLAETNYQVNVRNVPCAASPQAVCDAGSAGLSFTSILK